MSRQALSIFSDTLTASGAVTKHRAVGFDGAQATVQGQKVMAVSETDAVDGADFAATVIGTTVIESGAAVAVGNSLIVDAQGRAIPASALTVAAGATAVTSTAANGDILVGADLPDYVFADALQAAAAAGEFIEVLLRR